jgi:hypothetical protein
MHRRDALRFLGAAAIAPLVVPLSTDERWSLGESLHRRITRGAQAGRALSAVQMAEVQALAETIIPRTDTPGAADVGASEFVDLLLAEWYPDAERQQLLGGLDALSERFRGTHGNVLAGLPAEARQSAVGSIDGVQGSAGSAEWAYARIKDGLVFAFLTSEPISRIVNTMPIMPGRFDGCIPVEGAPR